MLLLDNVLLKDNLNLNLNLNLVVHDDRSSGDHGDDAAIDRDDCRRTSSHRRDDGFDRGTDHDGRWIDGV